MTLSATDRAQLDRHLEKLGEFARTELGYPRAFDIDYRPLEPFLAYGQNNIGDPFKSGSYRLNSHEFEREVLEFFASPIPCGIVLARRAHVDRIGYSVAYIGTRGTTISGSRDGFTPMLAWYAIKSLGEDQLLADILEEKGKQS